jgi:hypothetical protein
LEERHVKDILDERPFAALDEGEIAAARAHAVQCADCRRAFEAARASSLLLKGRASAAVEPSPFFQTRVLAALRERRAAEEVWSFGRLWKTAGALVASMSAAVALLAGLTFIAPDAPPSQGDDTQLAAASNIYPSDDSFFADDAPSDRVSDSQVLTTIYEQDDVR